MCDYIARRYRLEGGMKRRAGRNTLVRAVVARFPDLFGQLKTHQLIVFPFWPPLSSLCCCLMLETIHIEDICVYVLDFLKLLFQPVIPVIFSQTIQLPFTFLFTRRPTHTPYLFNKYRYPHEKGLAARTHAIPQSICPAEKWWSKCVFLQLNETFEKTLNPTFFAAHQHPFFLSPETYPDLDMVVW